MSTADHRDKMFEKNQLGQDRIQSCDFENTAVYFRFAEKHRNLLASSTTVSF
jgi:hypothetical protein